MFTKTKPEPTHLEKVIDLTLSQLEDLGPETEEFAKVVTQLSELHSMLPKKEAFMKPEALIAVAGNLAGILAILSYERVNVVTSKALGFVMKSRV